MSDNTTKTPAELKAQAQGQSYSEATTKLREKYRPEFNALVKAAMKTRGFDWDPQPTPAEKAEAEVARLLAEHPELAKKFAQQDTQPDD